MLTLQAYCHGRTLYQSNVEKEEEKAIIKYVSLKMKPNYFKANDVCACVCVHTVYIVSKLCFLKLIFIKSVPIGSGLQ